MDEEELEDEDYEPPVEDPDDPRIAAAREVLSDLEEHISPYVRQFYVRNIDGSTTVLTQEDEPGCFIQGYLSDSEERSFARRPLVTGYFVRVCEALSTFFYVDSSIERLFSLELLQRHGPKKFITIRINDGENEHLLRLDFNFPDEFTSDSAEFVYYLNDVQIGDPVVRVFEPNPFDFAFALYAHEELYEAINALFE